MTVSRVSTRGMYDQVYGAIRDKQKNSMDILNILSSPNKLGEVHNLVVNGDSRLVASMNSEFEYSNAYINSCSIVLMRTSVMDGALTDLMKITTQMENEMASSTHLKDMTFLKTVAVSKMREVQSILNRDLGGFHLFSGSKVDILPVPFLDGTDFRGCASEVCDNTNYYRGDHFVHTAMLSKDFCAKYGVHADDPAFVSLVRAIGGAIAASDAGDKNMLREAQAYAEDAFNGINALQQKVRYNYAKADYYKGMHQELHGRLNEVKDVLESDYGLDMLQLMSRHAEERITLEALQVFVAHLENARLSKYL